MVVVSRRTDFFGSTTAFLFATGLIVGSSSGVDSSEEVLGSSIEPGRADAPPIETGAVIVLSFTIAVVVASSTADDSLGRIVDSEIDVDEAELFSVVFKACTF